MSENTYNKPVPQLDDPAMGPFWQAAKDKRLVAQHCTSCGAWHFPALPICPGCLEQSLEWRDVAKSGTVHSFAVYHRAFHPGFREDLPYAVAIVETPEGVRYTGRIAGDRTGLKVGSKVRTVFFEATEAFTLPMWEIAED